MKVPELKPEAKVIIKDRYYVKDAIKMVPQLTNPEDVTDIVFQVGLNDFRSGLKAKEIQERTLEMQLTYHRAYPHARQHLTALPPLANGHNEVTHALQKLSSRTESNFISTKVFTDKSTGKLRAKTMEGIHYTKEFGVKILAKEIKKSLYSSANRQTTALEILTRGHQLTNTGGEQETISVTNTTRDDAPKSPSASTQPPLIDDEVFIDDTRATTTSLASAQTVDNDWRQWLLYTDTSV